MHYPELWLKGIFLLLHSHWQSTNMLVKEAWNFLALAQPIATRLNCCTTHLLARKWGHLYNIQQSYDNEHMLNCKINSTNRGTCRFDFLLFSFLATFPKFSNCDLRSTTFLWLKKFKILHTFHDKSAYVHCGRTVIYYTYDPISQPGDAWFNLVAIGWVNAKKFQASFLKIFVYFHQCNQHSSLHIRDHDNGHDQHLSYMIIFFHRWAISIHRAKFMIYLMNEYLINQALCMS